MNASRTTALAYPHAAPPARGTLTTVAEGIYWARLPLPFRLDHINIYFIDDNDGLAVLDTGIGDQATRAEWETLLDGPLKGRRLTRLIVTHYHPDHIGLAGWLCARFGLPLYTSRTSYLSCLSFALSSAARRTSSYRDFYLGHGLEPAIADIVSTRGNAYLGLTTGLPDTFERLADGDEATIGRRSFSVLSGDGHAPEQVMLSSTADGLFFAGDQVLAKITPNVSVYAMEPNANPLGLYLQSLDRLKTRIPATALVLPGHQLPFRGLHQRVDELVAHHEERCALIEAACHREPRSAAELLPVLFPHVVDPHQIGFAFSEVLAHVNHMLYEGRLVPQGGQGGIRRVAAPHGGPSASASQRMDGVNG